MTNSKAENLKFIMNRYDHYIDSVQSKSNLYISLNALIISGSLTMLLSINSVKLNNMLTDLIFVLILSSVISVIMVLAAIMTHLKTTPLKSLIFFGDVSSTKLNDYVSKIEQMNDEKFDVDLTKQIHCVSVGLTKKYKNLRWAGLTLIFQFIIIIFWTIIFIIKNK